MEKMFRAKGEGRTEMPPKPGIHPGGGDNFIHAMPAYIPDLKSAGIKWVSGFPENPVKGLPYISGLLILNDVDSGLPLAVMDCVWITAKRTGASSAISARYLARPESSIIGILGCGVQGRSHVEAFNVVFPLKKVMAYDVNPDTIQQYAKDIRSQLDLDVEPAATPRDAVSGCDKPEPLTLDNTPCGRLLRLPISVFLTLTGVTGDGKKPIDQARKMLEKGESALKTAGADFLSVPRTWMWLGDILKWYGDFNAVRNTFFTERGILGPGAHRQTLPAGELDAV